MSNESCCAVPMVHMNGTSRGELIEQYQNASVALYEALQMLNRASPNARDYYPMSPEAFDIARRQARARYERVNGALTEINYILEYLARDA